MIWYWHIPLMLSCYIFVPWSCQFSSATPGLFCCTEGKSEVEEAGVCYHLAVRYLMLLLRMSGVCVQWLQCSTGKTWVQILTQPLKLTGWTRASHGLLAQPTSQGCCENISGKNRRTMQERWVICWRCLDSSSFPGTFGLILFTEPVVRINTVLGNLRERWNISLYLSFCAEAIRVGLDRSVAIRISRNYFRFLIIEEETSGITQYKIQPLSLRLNLLFSEIKVLTYTRITPDNLGFFFLKKHPLPFTHIARRGH